MATADKNNVTKRSDKTSPLLQAEVDANFQELKNAISDIEGLEGVQNTLGSAAFVNTDAFDPAGTAATQVSVHENAAQAHNADQIVYDAQNTEILDATNVQSAIDELSTDFVNHKNDTGDVYPQYVLGTLYERNLLREALLKEATLNLDFANNKYEVYEGPVDSLTQRPFNDVLDFSRSSSASARNATGGITNVLANEQRLVGNREGLLLEEQRTNIALQSENFTSGNWVYGANVTVTADDIIAPDGEQTADRITLSGNTGHNISQGFSQVDGVDYTLSVWAKNLSGFTSTFQIAYYDSSTSVSSTSVALSNEWQRFDFTFTAQAGVTAPQIRLLGFGSGDDGDEVSIWGAQLEVGSFPTSYIKTEGSQVTRTGEECNRSLGQEFSADGLTLYTEYMYSGIGNGSASSPLLVVGNGGAASNAIWCSQPVIGGIRIISVSYPGGFASPSVTVDAVNKLVKAAVSFDASTKTLIGVVDVEGQKFIRTQTIPNNPAGLNLLRVGSVSSNNQVLNGTIYKSEIIPRVLSQSELEALTGGN